MSSFIIAAIGLTIVGALLSALNAFSSSDPRSPERRDREDAWGSREGL